MAENEPFKVKITETSPSQAISSDNEVYHFYPQENKFTALKDAAIKENMMRWNLAPFTSTCSVSYAEKLQFTDDQDIGNFLRDLFNSDAVRQHLKIATRTSNQVDLTDHVHGVKWSKLRCGVTSMAFFDRLQDAGIVAESGYIQKYLGDEYDGVMVADKLRETFLNPDSENADLFDDEEQQEYLYQLYKSIVTGGALCQYDDDWNQYNETTKQLYKNSVTVYKDSVSGDIRVSTQVFRVEKFDDDTTVSLFPGDNPHNSCFVCIDPLQRQVNILYIAWIPTW